MLNKSLKILLTYNNTNTLYKQTLVYIEIPM